MKKIHYVHIPKTGGSYVKRILISYFPYSSKMRPLGHGTICDAMDYGLVLNDHYTFAVIRNPWDRIHSYFNFIKYGTANGLWPTSVTKYKLYSEDFNTHIKKVYRENSDFKRDPLYWSQVEWIGWGGLNSILVDDLVPYPDIQDFMINLGKQYGVEESKIKNVGDRNITLSKDKPYQEEYTKETQDIVADIFRDDVVQFGFTFESGYMDGYSKEN